MPDISTSAEPWRGPTLPTLNPLHPRLKWYDPGVPIDIVVPDVPLPEFLRRAAYQHPDRAAIRFMGTTITFRSLDEAVNRFANTLRALGVRPGDRVAVLLPNCPQIVVALYGILRAGAVAVPTSPLSAEDELVHLWSLAGVRAAVTLSIAYPQVAAARSQVPSLEHVIVANIKDYFPRWTRLLFTLFRERKEGHRVRLPRDGHTHTYADTLFAGSIRPPPVSVHANDLALVQPTGGTTGTPKLAMLTHRNLSANAHQLVVWIRPVEQPGGAEIVLGAVPIFHIYGMTTVLTFCMVNASTMVLEPRFVVKETLKDLAHEQPTFFPGVPTMYLAINGQEKVNGADLRSLTAAISGAAPLPEEVRIDFEHLTGARLVEGYGLTEASPVTHCNPLLGNRKCGSIGLPLPATDAEIFDAETRTRWLPAGEVGELAVRGPQVMSGYWKEPEETADVLRDGWLFTGDLASVDEDGYFFIVDRKKDLIKSGGLNVFPREVEEPLFAYPKVKEAVVAGIPDPRWGEAVKAYIVLKPGETATEEEIIEYCRGKMARYKVPKQVEFRTELPENLIGKVLRRKLIEEEARAPRES